jgi:hypothetical protein
MGLAMGIKSLIKFSSKLRFFSFSSSAHPSP